jgi:hypothetical protein
MKILLLAIFLAHDWYPRECCNGNDCIKIPCEELGPGGTWNGKTPWHLNKSPDGKCHICVAGGGRGNFYCAFIPEVTS